MTGYCERCGRELTVSAKGRILPCVCVQEKLKPIPAPPKDAPMRGDAWESP